ncbi:phosphodiester glycosidase family protein [Pedobacter sp. BS3]|uniref:phosphodiester glycosidase family protein n=1 Tax=Pedobacter sp. BS3 TaxID=2567937 RepID=UPI0011EC50DC|nr:phosphodiester glycosidase family protein [Pedobacter sp. BS3]TZF84790.1 phosphodiester glycosidase family protein [Pedobacter sp. BS3]
MKRKLLLIPFLLASVIYAGCGKSDNPKIDKPPVVEQPAGEQTEAEKKITAAQWQTTQVSDAIVWKYYHFTDLFSAKQSVTVLDIDLNNKNLTLDIPYVSSGFLKTSEGATIVSAAAAINGGYFNTSTGGSTVFFKKDGQVITPTKSGFTSYRENAGMTIDNSRTVSVIAKPAAGWTTVSSSTLLVSGPLLVLNDKIIAQVSQSFNTERNPRAGVGVTKSNHLIAVVVDGRADEASGMTTPELAEVMKALGCQSAMNFDGGGSSTAWVKNHGVVNYPSDNKKFDHEGERGVATVIAFIMRN